MRYPAILIIALLSCGFSHGNTSGWHTLNVGGGGYMTAFGFPPAYTECTSDAKTARNDSGDGYYWNKNFDKWMWMNTGVSVSSVGAGRNSVYATAAACKDPQLLLFWYGTTIFKSVDGGLTYQPTTGINVDPLTNMFNDNNTGYYGKTSGPRLLFDVNSNDNVVYACSAADGAWVSTDRASTWQKLTQIPPNLPISGFLTRTTNAASAPGATTISLSSSLNAGAGSYIFDVTNPFAIPAGTVILPAVNGTTVTLSNPVVDGGSGGVQSGDTIRISNATTVNYVNANAVASGSTLTWPFSGNANISAGMRVYDNTNPDRIPVGTVVLSIPDANLNQTVVISQPVQNGGVVTNDSIRFVNDIQGEAGMVGCAVAVDPTSTVVDGVSQHVIIATAFNGIWETTTGPFGTWTKMAGGPTSWPVKVKYGPDGTLWYVSAPADFTATNMNVWRLMGGTWKQFTRTEISENEATSTLAINPADPNKVVVHAYLFGTTNALDTTPIWANQNFGPQYNPKGGGLRKADASDVPWLETTRNWMSEADMEFESVGNNKLYLAEGTGIWWTNPSYTHAAFDWNSQTRGIENLSDGDILSGTGDGGVITSSLDKSFMRSFPIWSFQNRYPSEQLPNTFASLNEGFGVDYATSGPNTICGIANNIASISSPGCSQNFGDMPWSEFGTNPWYFRVQTTASSASGQPVLHFGANLPSLLTTRPNSQIQILSNYSYRPVTTAETLSNGTNPAVLHFNAADIANVPLSAIIGTRVNVAPAYGLGNFILSTGMSCINITGSDCAGTAAGDVTLTTQLGPLPSIPAGQVVTMQPQVSIGNITVSCINVTGSDCPGTGAGDITLSSNLLNAVPSGVYVTIIESGGGVGGGSLAVYDRNNILLAKSDNDPYLYYTKDGGATWSRANISDGTNCSGGGACPGFNSDGSAILESGLSGWSGNYNNPQRNVAADRVLPNTFYALNCRTGAAGGGVYASYDGGDTWIRIYDGSTRISACQSGTKIMGLEGRAAFILMSGGPFFSSRMYRIRNADCGTPNCAVLETVGNSFTVTHFGASATKPGSTAPTIWATGKINGSTFVPGLYRSTDIDAATPTWQFVNGSFPFIVPGGEACLDGDKHVWYRVYICHNSGKGWAWGDFP